MSGDRHDSMGAIVRTHLLTGAFDAHIDRIEVHRITLEPAQETGRHTHPGGVFGYVIEGDISFEIDGQPAVTLHGGDVFYEPPGATIARFDNASDTATATFVALYPLAGRQDLIVMTKSTARVKSDV
jgi:quercetin dioxygenase-like cupin family protein